MAHDPHTRQFEDHTRAIAQGRPLTYTPEQLHAVHQIVAEGGNPLTDMHDLHAGKTKWASTASSTAV